MAREKNWQCLSFTGSLADIGRQESEVVVPSPGDEILDMSQTSSREVLGPGLCLALDQSWFK